MKNVLTPRAKELRRNQSDAELKLWLALRGRRLCRHKFKRQVPKGDYIVDFVCEERKLVVEVDGGQHAEEHVEYDQRRTDKLNELGYEVLRFWNSEVLTNIEGVLLVIAEALEARNERR
jgi:very-short-patch-repair endonuclease